jgi:hypothetical protein
LEVKHPADPRPGGRVDGRRVTGGYADVQGVRAQVGRWINDDDNVSGIVDPSITMHGITRSTVLGQLGMDVVVISDRIWREWFNGSPDIVDGTITLDHKPTRIIGVAPPGFAVDVDIWTPFGRRRLLTREELEKQRRPASWKGPPHEPQQPRIMVALRKDPDASTAVVFNRLNAIVAARAATADMPAGTFREPRGPQLRQGDKRLLATGYTILGFAALIFIAACANLGNMLFARAAERQGELAVRLSLGATRFGVFRLLLSETIAICAAASVAGLLFAAAVLYWFADAFPAFEVSYGRRVTLDLSIDWRIAGYAAGAGLAAALIVGAGSLWRSSRVSLLARLAASGPSVVAKTEGRTNGPSSLVAEAPSRGLSGTPTRINGSWVNISPGFIDTLGMSIVRGRDFSGSDQAGSDPVVLVTESTARRLWPGADRLGKRLVCCRATYMRRVVGVVPDPVVALDRPLTMDVGEALSEGGQFGDTGAGVFVFLPAAQHHNSTMLVVLRSDTPHTAIQSVRLLAGTLGIVALGIAVLASMRSCRTSSAAAGVSSAYGSPWDPPGAKL